MRTDDSLLRDPTAEAAPDRRAPREMPIDPKSGMLAILDIGKMRCDQFSLRLVEVFSARGYKVTFWQKPTNTRTAPLATLQEIAAEASSVIVSLSDCGSCTSCSTHDLNELDQRGVPGVSILTEEFRDAFDKQCGSIGFEGRSIFVPHPIQNRSDGEIRGLADAFADQIEAVLFESTRSEAKE